MKEKEIISQLCLKYNIEKPDCNLETFCNMLLLEGQPLHGINVLLDLATSSSNANTELLIAMITYGDFSNI